MKLAGREEELATIRRSLGGPGTHHGVVIVGSAGVGKTRLAREALSHAAASGHRTSWFVGTESARAIPLGAFTGSISQSMCDPLPDVRRVIDSFVAHQRMGKVVIGVDDAHLLDPLSAHVVHQLAQTQGVRLVVTARSGGPEPDAVTALWKDSLLDRIDLEPLSAAAAATLIESAVAGPVDSRSTRRFWKLTGGNALYLLQLVKDQIAAGRMRKSAGVWMWDGDVAVSQSITDMVGRRLGGLEPGMALVLDTLSQCEPLSVDVLGDLVEPADLEAAEQMHLVRVDRSGRGLVATLAHPLYGECAGRQPGRCTCRGSGGNSRGGWSRRPTEICGRRSAARCWPCTPTCRRIRSSTSRPPAALPSCSTLMPPTDSPLPQPNAVHRRRRPCGP